MRYSGRLYSPLMDLCTHVDHRLYKYTLGSEQDASSPTELSSLFEPPLFSCTSTTPASNRFPLLFCSSPSFSSLIASLLLPHHCIRVPFKGQLKISQNYIFSPRTWSEPAPNRPGSSSRDDWHGLVCLCIWLQLLETV
jgi:hypothetical protein